MSVDRGKKKTCSNAQTMKNIAAGSSKKMRSRMTLMRSRLT